VGRRQVIDDVLFERVHERVAAVDVAKKDGVVCLRQPHPSRAGQRQSVVWAVAATMSGVRELAAQLVAARVQKVSLESASDYWRIWFYVLEEAGLEVALVNASQARSLPGRPKTGKLDAVWLARLTGLGMLRPSFVPPAEIRVLRGYTRARSHLTGDRTRCFGRLEKLLEDALIKVSSVASKLTTESARDMIAAMIAGQRDPAALAALARGRMKSKRDVLTQALEGMFGDHHAELAQLLLDQASFCDQRITRLDILIKEQLATIRSAWGIDAGGETGPAASDRDSEPAPVLPAAARLDEIPGVSAGLAAAIIAETGLDMTRFPAAAHLVSRAGLCPRAINSGPRTRHGKSHGNAYLRGALGQAATGASRTATFPGARYDRIARRRGKARAQVAVARSILLSRPGTRFRDCSRPVSPDLSPHPPCVSPRNGRSTVTAVRLVQLPRGRGSWCRGSGTGRPGSPLSSAA
jgi:transposase